MTPLPFSAGDLSATLAPFEEARPLPPAACWDEDVFAFDRDAIFGRAWLCVGHERNIAEPGAWMLAPITPEGILVLRGEDGRARAFYNACRHRGATLVDAPCGRAEALACPYHRWTYALDGALRAAPGARPGLDRTAAGLVPVRMEAWNGFLFVNLDPDAPELEHALAGAPPWLAKLPELARIGQARYEVRANWKLCVANFQESHHFPLVHPALEALTPTERAASLLGDGPWLGGLMDIVPSAETVSKSGRRLDRPFLVAEDARRRVRDAHLFPGLLTSLQPDYFLTYRLHPIAPDRTLVIAETYAHPDCPAGESVTDVLDFWARVNAEDRAVCERQQIGIRSRGYAPIGYAAVEDGVHAFDRLVARRYAEALEEQESSNDDPPDSRGSEPPPPAPIASRLGKLVGIWGKPYIDLSSDIDISCFPMLDDEITYGLARVQSSRTGGSLKHMGVVAPWVRDDPYVDYGDVIASLSREEFVRFVSLAEDPSAFDPEKQDEYAFGDETDNPLSPAQMAYLIYRHRVYFPWRVCYHLLENDCWEDKHSGAGKDFTAEARAVFPRTVAFIESLPFTEVGRAVLFGLEANDHAPLHRDSEPGRDLTIAQSISFQPRGDKRLYLVDADGGSRTVVTAPIYWFNDMDYHGVLPDPFFRYSVRVDGVLDPAWARALARRHRR
ncbi:Phenylpropionate dioxygenase [Minicystis rosea]|nr:Phenylpropionate dioxygenase [Minicystis rosea]